ncbi:group III truncated hemoglobin [Reichenbachiella carrageenanivorans]|uniref:Group III truncated hemoglobin n=1 Tax=Reichenbachiella carrageenanivorans TaxID=2979869 RepID=A0ABY6CYQ1_9BACT|nr:group III truncated hemoglobin [Reichenbachiella carrageenanivorans]UXX79037.1 group III truncated hemoglobin [Reichenbachiella carrageenanivorans]
MTQEILQIEDIKKLVNSFYAKVRKDDVLADIFNARIGNRWPEHLEKMYRFWQTVLLEEHTYFGSPFLPHANLPIAAEHFDRWIQLFFQTIDEEFHGEKAERAKWQGQRMAEMFLSKIEYHRENKSKPLL